jgi:hypothetical protein
MGSGNLRWEKARAERNQEGRVGARWSRKREFSNGIHGSSTANIGHPQTQKAGSRGRTPVQQLILASRLADAARVHADTQL